MTDPQADYRKYLVDVAQKTAESFDKTILALSGGALGVSIAFVKDIVHKPSVVYAWSLYAAWGCWLLSVSLLLVALYFATLTYQQAVKDFDAGKKVALGGKYGRYLNQANLWAMLLFVVGVLFMMVFAAVNL